MTPEEEIAQLKARVAELETQIPRQPDGVLAFQARIKAYAEKHPGFCPKCGLPPLHCFHKSEEYRSADRNPCNPAFRDTLRGLYLRGLGQMSDLSSLPPAPTAFLARILKEERDRRGEDNCTVWDLLNAEYDE